MSLSETRIVRPTLSSVDILPVAESEGLDRIQIIEVEGLDIRVRLAHNDDACEPQSSCRGYVVASFLLGQTGEIQPKKCSGCRAHPLVNLTVLQIETGMVRVQQELKAGKISITQVPQLIRDELMETQKGLQGRFRK